MKIINGIIVNFGISIAKVKFVDNNKIKPTSNKIAKNKIKSEVDLLTSIFDKCHKNTINKLDLYTKGKKLKIQKDIVEAHLAIIDDEIIFNEIKDEILNNKWNASYAVHKIFSKYGEQFKKMNSDYFRERQIDLIDIENQLLAIYFNKEIVKLDNIRDVIIFSNEFTPTQLTTVKDGQFCGFISKYGGKTSHVSLIIKSLGIPYIFGINDFSQFLENDVIILDGNDGLIIINPDDKTLKKYLKKQDNYRNYKKIIENYKTCKTISKDNKKILVKANIGNYKDVKKAVKNNCDGIGLFRTELLYMERNNWPTEDFQFNNYKKIIKDINPYGSVIIRTLDIGSDKQLSYYDFSNDFGKCTDNSSLGIRAIRFSLAKKKWFIEQITAILRASEFGKVRIMIPMIACIEELNNAKKIIKNCESELLKKNPQMKINYEIGMMIETPNSVYNAEIFAKNVSFFSIGSNDLIQYSMAADRLNKNVDYLYQPLNPGILKAISFVIKSAEKNNIECSVCGAIAAEKNVIPILFGLGLKSFSVSVPRIKIVRYYINNLKFSDCKILAEKALKLESEAKIKALVDEFLSKKGLF